MLQTTSSLLPVSPGDNLCPVCVNKCRILPKRTSSRHLSIQQSWALVQYCAELGLILKKYLTKFTTGTLSSVLPVDFSFPSRCYKNLQVYTGMCPDHRERQAHLKPWAECFDQRSKNCGKCRSAVPWRLCPLAPLCVVWAARWAAPLCCRHWRYLSVEWALQMVGDAFSTWRIWTTSCKNLLNYPCSH